jgi:hypothetical protein
MAAGLQHQDDATGQKDHGDDSQERDCVQHGDPFMRRGRRAPWPLLLRCH